MSNRIDLAPEATPNLGGQRLFRNLIAVGIVIITTVLFAIFSPKTEIIKANLIGEGCAKTDLKGVKCELSIGEKKLMLRECSEEMPCNQSEYELGKKKENKQYIVVSSEAFTKSIQVLAIDTENMSQVETQNAFYTEVKDSCKSKNNPTQDCFDFPISEDQLKDISDQNQKYNNLLKEYSLN
jgi:hypothetical protein